MKFNELGVLDSLIEVLQRQEIVEPTAVQEKLIPAIMQGINVSATAPTGTGKTLAYILPTIAKIDTNSRDTQAVIIAPTYELAMQITNVARVLIAEAGLNIKVQGLIGGANIARQIEKLREHPQLIIGSAGRMVELARKGKLKLNAVKLFILDEFDRLLDKQNIMTVADLVKLLPKDRQIVMTSATASKKALEQADFLGSPEHIAIKESAKESAARENLYLIVPFREKIEMVRRLSRSLGVKRGLVFINRIFDAEKTLAHLKYDGVKAGSLLGKGDKQERQSAIAAIKSGKITLLLATDIAARGIDIPDVDYVFNLDIPESGEIYRHRAGRTARAGKKGTVITLADIKEAAKLAALEKKLGIELKSLKKGAMRLTSAAKKSKNKKPVTKDKTGKKENKKNKH